MEPQPIFQSERSVIPQDVILITGLANASNFISHVESKYTIKNHFEFRDHHNFTNDDFDQI